MVLMLDECHLLWGDICSYLWGKTSERVEIPILNEKERQTYFGAVNYQTREFFVQRYENGDSEHTIQFLKYLQSQFEGKRLLIFWDGVGYHKSQQIREYLASVNMGLESDNWHIKCVLFAPNDPSQNPVEDIWLQAKQFIRKFSCLCRSFSVVKWLFEFLTHHQIFDFPKLYEYGFFS